MSSGLTNTRWYALHVRPQCERSVSFHLRERGQESLLPLYKTRSSGNHQSSGHQGLLFPGYVFCRIDWERGPKLYLIPGIISVVGMGKNPVPIEDDEIEALRRITETTMDSEPCPFGNPGTPVRVVKGPLAGIEGIVDKRAENEMVISVSLLRRSVAVKIDPDWLSPIAGPLNSENRLQDTLPVSAETTIMEYNFA